MRQTTAVLTTIAALSLAVTSTAEARDEHRLARLCERREPPMSPDSDLRLRATLSTLVPTLYGRIEHDAAPARSSRRESAGALETIETRRLLFESSPSVEWEIGLRWNLLSALDRDDEVEGQTLDERTEAVEDLCADLAAARRRATSPADDRFRDRLAEELAERKLEAVESGP